jgi:hypothetical protein
MAQIEQEKADLDAYYQKKKIELKEREQRVQEEFSESN